MMKTPNRINRLAIAFALVVAGVGTAQAEGLYIGAALGSPDYKSSVNGISGNGSGPGGKVYGGYRINPNFALEAGYFDLGHNDDAAGRVNVRGAFFDGVGLYEFAPTWTVLGRVGVAQGKFTTTNGDDSSPGLRVGAGVEYALNKTIALRAEYAHYHFSSVFGGNANIGEFTFGVKYGF